MVDKLRQSPQALRDGRLLPLTGSQYASVDTVQSCRRGRSDVAAVLSADLEECFCDLAEGADAGGLHEYGEDVVA